MLALAALLAAVRAQERPVECGNGVLEGGEGCDDGNDVGGDGCSALCVLEDGYMCRGFWRAPAGAGAPGSALGPAPAYAVDATPSGAEACAGAGICRVSSLWQPELWQHMFAAGRALPPRGHYCAETCALFPAPAGHGFSTDCAPRDVDECVLGRAACDYNAFCVNESPGYACRCAEEYFVSRAGGRGCEQSGVQLDVFVVGRSDYSGAESPPADAPVLAAVYAGVADALLRHGLVRNSSAARAVLLEGGVDFPAELVRVLDADPSAGRALWRLRVRSAMSRVDIFALLQSALLANSTLLQAEVARTVPGAGVLWALHPRSACSNERARGCAASADCLGGGECWHDRAEGEVQVLNAGGAGAPLQAQSAGMQLLSVAFDTVRVGWVARVRYATTGAPGVLDVLYLSRVEAQRRTPTGAEVGSFRPDEFPCQAPGTGAFQQGRDDSACCLERLRDAYTTTLSFGAYLADPARALGAALARQGACGATRVPPRNHTAELLAAGGDHVTGGLARMPRSHAMADAGAQTRGYRDVLLFLAEEDMRSHGGIEAAIAGGYNFRFLVGMAHVRGLRSDRLQVDFAHELVVSDITQAFSFTSSGQTDFTFVKDVGVELLQVRDAAPGGAGAKFARVQLTVPRATAPADLAGFLPASGARAAVGFSRASAGPAVYPCVQTYSGAERARVDALLLAQAWCAPQEPVCAPSGVTAGGGQGSVFFVFPLGPDAWAAGDLLRGAGELVPSLFLDFVVRVRDGGGRTVLSRVQTATPIRRGSVARHCEQRELSSSIAELVEVDLFLGLTDSAAPAAFDANLVYQLDITRTAAPGALGAHLARALSSREANVATLLVKGAPALFEQAYSAAYSLEVEDLVTLHFLDPAKKTQAEALLAGGQAFAMDAASGRARLVPSDALLALCPVHAVRGVLGCVTRLDVQGRLLDFRTQSIVEISPPGPAGSAATVARASQWAQVHLGTSAYVAALAAAHARVMADKFALNSRYRRGYMLAPQVPWRQTDMLDQGIVSALDLAQHSLTVVMVSLDQGGASSALPTVELSIPGALPLAAQQLRSDALLLAAVESSYAQALGADAGNVHIDPDSIQDAGAAGAGGGRRLLAGAAQGCTFAVVLELVIADAREGLEIATNLRADLQQENSPVGASIMINLNVKVRALVPSMPPITRMDSILPPGAVFAPPQGIAGCREDSTWALNLTAALGLAAPRPGGTAWLGCGRRFVTVGGVEAPPAPGAHASMGVRGPQQPADWEPFFDGTHSSATDPAQQALHWQWWDMCAPPPMGQFFAGAPNAFAAGWARVRAQAREKCCLCFALPKVPQSQRTYTHRYAWPLAVVAATRAADFAQHDRRAVMLSHPQLRSFHATPPGFFDPAGAPPRTWSVGADARTVVQACPAGAWLAAAGACEPCAPGTFRAVEASHFDWGACQACPAQSTSPPASASAAACACRPGHTPDPAAGGACAPCAAHTYKPRVGGANCTACPQGFEAPAGAAAAGECAPPPVRANDAGGARLFQRALGLLGHRQRVEAWWAEPRPQAQDNARQCALADGGAGLLCDGDGGGAYAGVFAPPVLAGTSPNALRVTEVGAAGAGVLAYHGVAAFPARVQLHMFPAPGAGLQIDGAEREDLKGAAALLALFPRPGYMGPAPPGFVQQVYSGRAWEPGTAVAAHLRRRLPGSDLRAQGASPSRLRMVLLVADRELDTAAESTAWQWLVCGAGAPGERTYAACATGPDPDTAGAQNLAHPAVLDLRVFELSGAHNGCCQSCFHGAWWLGDCGAEPNPDAASMFDATVRWTPAIGDTSAPPPVAAYTLAIAGGRYAVAQPAGAALLVTRGVATVFRWPKGETLLVTERAAAEVTWPSSAHSVALGNAHGILCVVDADAGTTTLTVPAGFRGRLSLLSLWDSGKGLAELTLLEARTAAGHPPFRSPTGQFWLYAFFMLSESAACLDHACNEAAVYGAMPAHLAAAPSSAWATPLEFLPGTEFVATPPRAARAPAAPVLREALGVLDQPRCALSGARGLRCTDAASGAAHTDAAFFAQDMQPAAARMPLLPVVALPSADILAAAALCSDPLAECPEAVLVDPARVPELRALLLTPPPHEATLWRAGTLQALAGAPAPGGLELPAPRDAPCAESSFRVHAAVCARCPPASFLTGGAAAGASLCAANATAAAAALPPAQRPGPGYEVFFGGYYET